MSSCRLRRCYCCRYYCASTGAAAVADAVAGLGVDEAKGVRYSRVSKGLDYERRWRAARWVREKKRTDKDKREDEEKASRMDWEQEEEEEEEEEEKRREDNGPAGVAATQGSRQKSRREEEEEEAAAEKKKKKRKQEAEAEAEARRVRPATETRLAASRALPPCLVSPIRSEKAAGRCGRRKEEEDDGDGTRGQGEWSGKARYGSKYCTGGMDTRGAAAKGGLALFSTAFNALSTLSPLSRPGQWRPVAAASGRVLGTCGHGQRWRAQRVQCTAAGPCGSFLGLCPRMWLAVKLQGTERLFDLWTTSSAPVLFSGWFPACRGRDAHPT
ncbi:hypothetical protein CCMA1212_001811 [Trichoderma ghanense]|uniref:Uncharacterized protein n=1 Tax=Trichoderma ghanense TaxID=65468 RepID=A0ABY2HCT1_9HYPO